MINILAVIANVVFDLIAGQADAAISEEGFAKGYQEANEAITTVFRNKKPTYFDLTIWHLFKIGLFATPGFVFHNNSTIVVASCVVLAVDAIAHLRAVSVWKKAFETNGASLNVAKTIWQKLF